MNKFLFAAIASVSPGVLVTFWAAVYEAIYRSGLTPDELVAYKQAIDWHLSFSSYMKLGLIEHHLPSVSGNVQAAGIALMILLPIAVGLAFLFRQTVVRALHQAVSMLARA